VTLCAVADPVIAATAMAVAATPTPIRRDRELPNMKPPEQK
jgi:hypothetical protein